MEPYVPYSAEDFTSAPAKHSITEKPPDITVEDEMKVVKEKVINESYVNQKCKVGEFVILPAAVWADIQQDNMPYSVAKCLHVDKDGKYGVFQRYGNYRGLLGPAHKLLPGYFDKKDKKYFYTDKATYNTSLYTNDLTRYGIPEQKICVWNISITFPKLTDGCRVPKKVQEVIDIQYPEYKS